jgi:hypothetical protein
MTNFEALRAMLTYPVDDAMLTLALTNRGIAPTGLTENDTYTIGNKESVDLAYADILMLLVSSPNISEGGYSVSLADKASLKEVANGIYDRYNKRKTSNPKIKFRQAW